MATEIELLWNHSANSPKEQRINGGLLAQATYICYKCGSKMEKGDKQCITCGNSPGDD